MDEWKIKCEEVCKQLKKRAWGAATEMVKELRANGYSDIDIEDMYQEFCLGVSYLLKYSPDSDLGLCWTAGWRYMRGIKRDKMSQRRKQPYQARRQFNKQTVHNWQELDPLEQMILRESNDRKNNK